MINITFNPNTFELSIEGHAGHGKKGEDIVCSAISTLFYTLGQALSESKHMIDGEITFKDEDGKGFISCKPKAEYVANVSLIYWTILTGLDLVSKNYKKNIKMRVVG